MKILQINGDNGVRLVSGQLNYVIADGDFAVGGYEFDSKDYTYNINGERVKITSEDLQVQTQELKGENKVRKVNILTPLNISDQEAIMETTDSFNQTIENVNKCILQKGVKFTVNPSCQNYNKGRYEIDDTNKYVRNYYIVCDFDVSDVDKGTALSGVSSNGIYGSYTAFEVKKGDTFSAIPISIEGDTSVSQVNNHIYVFATTYNIPGKLEEQFKKDLTSLATEKTVPNFKYIDKIFTLPIDIDSKNEVQLGYLNNKKRLGASNHIVYRDIVTNNIARIYDFAITDCTDVNFKNSFRKNQENNVNSSTGIVYYSGVNRLLVTGTTGSKNDSAWYTKVDNTNTILPLGPYKNVDSNAKNTTYIFAPKLGYRFSYDLKTTGYLSDKNSNNSRKVVIFPRYYYIGKNGENFKSDIDLYFKDNSGKYKKLIKYTRSTGYEYEVDDGAESYNIYMKPNDGYRYSRQVRDWIDVTRDFDFDNLSNKLVKIPISTGNTKNKENIMTTTATTVLNNKMMALTRDSFTQAWYGEFKLPNTTIAVENNDIANPLKDGYIGVIFDIYCVDNNGGYTLAYSKDTSGTNTSQWDYEGYLGFKTPGKELKNNISLQLEKGVWNINNETYNQIKGTVILYDTDDRAANDFE